MLKLVIALILGLGFVTNSLASERVVVVTHGQASDPFWSVVKNGVHQAAKDFDLNVEYHAPDTFDMAAMARIIDGAVAKRPGGLIVSVPDKDALSRSINNARRRGIPVISINAGAEHQEDLDILLHIGQSEFLAGLGAAKKLVKSGAKKGLCVHHEQGNAALDKRCEGFVKGFEGKAEILAVNMDPTEIRTATQAYLKQNADVDAILALGAIAAPPVVVASQKSSMKSKPRIVSFDSSPEILKLIQEGAMTFAIDQQQYLQGYLAVQSMAQYKRLGLLASGAIQTGPGFITKGNAAQVVNLSKKGIR